MSVFHSWYRTLRHFVLAHKIWSGLILVVILLVAWYAYGALTNTSGETRYVVGTVREGTIVSAVTESGQVASNQTLNITPQGSASGEITALDVVPGQQVTAGQAIATIDPTQAEQAVESAKQNLQAAQLTLAQLQEPATALTLAQQQDAITQDQQNLTTLYADTFSDITNTFVDLPAIMAGLQDSDLGTEAGGSSVWNINYYETQAAQYNSAAQSYETSAYNDYIAARDAYDQNFNDFQAAGSSPNASTTEALLAETYATTGLVEAAVKSDSDLVQFYIDTLTQNGATPKAVASTQETNLTSWLSKTQTHLSALLSDTNNLQSDENTLTQAQLTLQQTQAGPDALAIQQDQLNIEKAQLSLQQAQQTLSDYYVTAPFSGTIASVPVNLYDQASGGTTLATLVTNAEYANLSVNEVDAAKLQLGQQATLTFNAIPNLTLTGTVAQINPVGTVSQGVVTYTVEIAFTTQDPRVKSGMSVNAAIQTGVAENVLEVPVGAIKTQGAISYVQAFEPPLSTSTVEAAGSQGVLTSQTPINIPVEAGLTDDTNTQILSGLSLGQQIIDRSIKTGTVTPATTATTGGGGFGGGGGAALRL